MSTRNQPYGQCDYVGPFRRCRAYAVTTVPGPDFPHTPEDRCQAHADTRADGDYDPEDSRYDGEAEDRAYEEAGNR